MSSKHNKQRISFRSASLKQPYKNTIDYTEKHNKFILKLSKNRLILPRYDALTKNNNNSLVVHIDHTNNLKDLKPKYSIPSVAFYEQKIKQYQKSYSIQSTKTNSIYLSTINPVILKDQIIQYRSTMTPTLKSLNKYCSIEYEESGEDEAKFKEKMVKMYRDPLKYRKKKEC